MLRKFALSALVGTLLSGCVYTYEVPTRRVVRPAPVVDVAYRTAPRGSVAAQVGAILNRERQSRGLSRLSYNRSLTNAARRHADYLSTQGRSVSHYGPRGETPMARVKAQGYGACRTAENLGMGQDSPEEIMRDWMSSSGHRSNNLMPQVREFGLAQHPQSEHWVLVLASRGC